MIRILYHHKGKEQAFTIPAAWDELSRKQLLKLAILLHSSSQAPALHTQARILQLLTGKGRLAFIRIPAEVRFKALEHLSWMENNTLTRQLLPSYKGFYGPASDFDNIVLAEFHHAELAYYNYIKSGEPEHLNELIAVLYRRPKAGYNKKLNKEGDTRSAFNYAEAAYNKKKIATWSKAFKLAVLLWYDGCRQNIVKLYPAAFNSAQDPSGTAYFQGLYKMIRSLSGDKYGTFDQVEKLPLHTAFMEIICSLEEAAELQNKMHSNI